MYDHITDIRDALGIVERMEAPLNEEDGAWVIELYYAVSLLWFQRYATMEKGGDADVTSGLKI